MTNIAGAAQKLGSLPWWLQALYAVLAVSALALATLVVGEIVDAFESNSVEDGTQHPHHHASYDRIFDAAWVVFVPSFLIALIAGATGLVAGKLRGSRALTAYGARALAYCGSAVVIVVLADALGS
jgi:hypothetical protein